MTTESNAGAGDAAAEDGAKRGWLTRGVGAVGAASFFSDAGHEVTTSALPTFITATLDAPASALGVIDGISDALIGVMKLVGGPLANDPDLRGRAACGGYLGTALATGAIGAAVTVWQAGLFRAIAWLSRGVALSGAGRAAGVVDSCVRTGQGIRFRACRRQLGGGGGPAAGSWPGGLARGATGTVSGGHPRFLLGSSRFRGH